MHRRGNRLDALTTDNPADRNTGGTPPALEPFLPAPPPVTPLPELDEEATLPAHIPAHDAPPLRLFGRYELLQEIAQGGMGVVYKAHDRELRRVVALKMLRGGLLARGPEVERFRREARAAGQLDHPGIVPILDIGECEGRHYFTMPFEPGGSLADRGGRSLPARRAAQLVARVARAVQYAHDRRILHRDLKPANILLDANGEPLVADFGLAKFLDASSDLTQTGEGLGTPAYMAPEQALGLSAQVGAHTDVWGLGVILYELLTGQRPFTSSSRQALTREIESSDPPRPLSLCPGLSRDLENIVLKCLQKQPANRYPTAAALAEDLERWLRGEAPRLTPAAQPVRPGASRTARGRALRLAALVAGLAAVALLAVPQHHAPALSDEERETLSLQREQRAIHAELVRTGRASLLTPAGLPRLRLWPLGKGRAVMHPAAGGPARLTLMDGTVLLELFPDPPPRFRVSAELLHVSATDAGRVGVYGARSHWRSGQGEEYAFAALTFADVGGQAFFYPPFNVTPQNVAQLKVADMGSRVFLDTCRQRQANAGTSFSHTNTVYSEFVRPKRGEWRKLILEGTPDELVVFWAGKLLWRGPWDRCRVPLTFPTPRAPLPPTKPLSPRGGLGLIVTDSSVEFRNVFLEITR
jgi:tRNA A-37 threonylcarbamoyl transferase component Bud32